MNIKILDCTLRDGGYINDWDFDNKNIIEIINSLEKSKIDIIECGYLNEINGSNDDSTLFDSIKSIDKLLTRDNSFSLKVAMINFGDFSIELLPECKETKLDGIRFAFHKKDLSKALIEARKIIEKGYKLFFQPMVSVLYTNDDFKDLIKKSNELKPYAFYIVDSFGSMQNDDLKTFIDLASSNLNRDVLLGFHSHNNLQLAFSNSIFFIDSLVHREIIIDSSTYGMGRGAGNLNTELITDYLNQNFNKNYQINNLLEIIDNYLESIHEEKYWGFSLAYYLSGKFKLHPNYATYLVNKKTLPVNNINKLLQKIKKEKSYEFDKDYIETLYLNQYENQNTTDLDIFNDVKNVLIVASGKSIKNNVEKIKAISKDKNLTVITVNHMQDEIKSDFYFYSNQKRFNEFKSKIDIEDNLIITSNISNANITSNLYEVNFNELYSANETFCDNVTILLLNILYKSDINNVFIAGLDGYDIHSNENYSYNEYSRVFNKDTMSEHNKEVSLSLKKLSKLINIELITPTILEYTNEKDI